MIARTSTGSAILLASALGLVLAPVAGAARAQEPAAESPGPEEKPPRLASVEAPILRGITVDGDLSDWPDTIGLQPIDSILDRNLPNYGKNGLEEDALATSPDLSAVFSVVYDPDADLIYLAIIVRDDSLIVGHKGYWDTDSVEVYVDGRFTEEQVPFNVVYGREEIVDASELPVLQYLGIPGEGRVYGIMRSAGEDRGPLNPALSWGDITRTKTRMAFAQDGDVTVYEWALQAFDRYPDRPTDLEPGKRIGFDVVVDKDVPASTESAEAEPADARSAWVSWFPEFSGPRFFNAATVGELVLGGDREPGRD